MEQKYINLTATVMMAVGATVSWVIIPALFRTLVAVGLLYIAACQYVISQIQLL